MATPPIILVDMDGPLANFDLHFFDRCNENQWKMDCDHRGQTERFATEHIPDKKHRAAAREMVNSPGWFADLPVVPGAVEGINKLADEANVWICTKPLEVNPTCRDDKGQWVRTHFGPEWERRLIITPDKSIVMGDVLLDDAPHVAWYSEATWRPVIYSAGYNGTGTKWADLPHWTWDDPISTLVEHALR